MRDSWEKCNRPAQVFIKEYFKSYSSFDRLYIHTVRNAKRSKYFNYIFF